MVKFPAPSKFNGTTIKASTWIREVDRYVKIYGMTEQHKILYTAMLFTSNAQIWWNTLEINKEEPTSWKAMKNAIIDKFQTINEAKRASEKIYQTKQLNSVANYIAEFDSTAIQIPDLGKQEEFRLFLRGLKAEIRNEMEKRGIKKLSQLKAEAAAYDDLLFAQRTQYGNN